MTEPYELEPEWDSEDSNAYQDRIEAGLEPEWPDDQWGAVIPLPLPRPDWAAIDAMAAELAGQAARPPRPLTLVPPRS